MTHLLILICGLPAAGKSTLARTLAAHQEVSKLFDVSLLSIDDIYEELSLRDAGGSEFPAAWSPLRWHDARRCALERATEMLNPDAAARRRLVIVDDNFYYRSMRRVYYNLAAEARAGFLLVYCAVTPAESALRDQARSSPYRVGREVIERMAARFQPPRASNCVGSTPETSASGAWEAMHTLQLDVASCDNGSDASAIQRQSALLPALREVAALVPPAQEIRVPSDSPDDWRGAALQSADLALRRCVSETLSSPQSLRDSTTAAVPGDTVASSRQRLAATANAVRKRVLQYLRGREGNTAPDLRRVDAVLAESGEAGDAADGDEPADRQRDAFVAAVRALYVEELAAASS